MKKLSKFIKSNIKKISAFIIGAVLFSGLAAGVAATMAANGIVYIPPSGSSISTTNVKDAIDDLYTESQSWVNPSNMGLPLYYAFGTPTTESETDYTQVGWNVYVGLYADGQYGVCINRSGTEHCFRYNNWIAESKHIQELFSGSNDSCIFRSSSLVSAFVCNSSDFGCNVNSNGYVSCSISSGVRATCYVDGDGTVECFY